MSVRGDRDHRTEHISDPSVAQRRFQALLQHGSDLSLICDRDLVIRFAGPSLAQMFGYQEDEVLGVAGLSFVHPDDVDTFVAGWQESLTAPGRHVRVEIRVRHRDGSWRWVEERITNLLDDPDVGGVVLNVRDVTERRRVTEALAQSEQWHRSILEAAQEGIWVVDPAGETLFANQRMAELLKTTHAQLRAGNVWMFNDREGSDIVRAQMNVRAAGVREQYEIPVVRGDGERRWLRIAGSPLHDAEGRHVANIGMCVDVTERKQMEQELERLALYDSLTGLPNRALKRDRMQQFTDEHERNGSEFALLFCDLDRFKMVNEAYGHRLGDQVLIAVAQRLEETAREHDTVTRFGGDAFIILCAGADSYVGSRVAEELRRAIELPFDIAGQQVYVTMSVGVASTAEVTPDDLQQAAEIALYKAKESGRSQVLVHDVATAASGADRLQLVTELRHALDRGQLEVRYQPIVRLGGGSPAGVEALLRWTHPQKGAISPSVFIPLAEKNGLMPRLGAWSLQRACRDAAAGVLKGGEDWYVSVNLSATQLTDPAVVDVVRTTLRATGLPARRLMLEVTETAVLDNTAHALSSLHEMKALGVRVALDDFGTGYSSLTYLREFPVDMIKIDRSFVAGLGTDEDDSAIVASLVSLAAAIGVQAVAEGVETATQEQLLRSLGCPLGQGYLWSTAAPVGEIAAVLTRLAHGQGQARRGRARKPSGARPVAEPDEATVARIVALHRSGASLNTIAAVLNADDVASPRGTRWHRNAIARIVARRQFPDLRI
jgi:diguanylate cyclase (GGDEF)-like protein/PAS domain S-box-containing protein